MSKYTIRKAAPWIVATLLCLLWLPWLGETLFYSKGEPREALVAMSMLQSGDWILPLSFGELMPYKPPMLAWCIAIPAKIFNGGNVSEYIARMPSAIAAIAMIMAMFVFVRRSHGTRIAALTAIVTATSFEVFRAATACRLDMLLTSLMVCAILMLYDLRERRGRHRRLRYAAVWALLSAAVLTKGPIGSLLPCFITGIYCLLRGDRFFATLARMLALAISAMLPAALWFVAAYNRGGDDFAALMYEENLGRLFGSMSYDSHNKPLWYNFTSIAAGMLPWTLLALLACPLLRKLRRRPIEPASLLSLIAAATVFVFYCIPDSKRSVYLLPMYPFMAFGIAMLIEYLGRHNRRPLSIYVWIIACLAIVAPAAIVALWHMTGIPVNVQSGSWWQYIMLCLPAAAGATWLIRRKHPAAAAAMTAWALFVAYSAAGAPSFLNPLSNRDAAARIESIAPAPAPIYTLGHDKHSYYFSLDFYTGDRMRVFPGTLRDAVTTPPGTVFVLHSDTDTTACSDYFNIDTLTERGADYRRPLLLAVRKPSLHDTGHKQ